MPTVADTYGLTPAQLDALELELETCGPRSSGNWARRTWPTSAG